MYGTIDTGAAVSIISGSQQKALFPNAKLESSKVLRKTYPGALTLTEIAGGGA